MSGARDELREMAKGFRWGRRPLVPRSAEPYALEKDDEGFPTDWARSNVGVSARQVLLKGVMKTILSSELSMRVHGLDNLDGVDAPVLFFSNHTSHLDATIIMTTLPDAWQTKTAVGAARDYFFDVWWRQAFTALVYGAFPIERGSGSKGVSKARQLLDDGWSIVVFPEGTRSPDGHVQRFRHGTARLCLEAGVSAIPIGIRGAYQAMPKGRNWPRPGRPTVSVRYGRPIVPEDGETHQAFSRRMSQAIAQLHDEDRSTWWDSLQRARSGETPSLAGPHGPGWLRKWEGSRPVPRRGPEKVWE
jgi:1-acyl-sn-glycerol-3-phosphate acyltransferase